MRIEDVVGQNIKAARERAGLSQEELGQRLAVHLGAPWRRRQAISTAETGRRAFTAAEIATISSVLGVSVNALFASPLGERYVEVGGDDEKPVDVLGGGLLQVASDMRLKSRVWDALADLREAEAQQIELIGKLLEGVRPMDAAIDTLAEGLEYVFSKLDPEPEPEPEGDQPLMRAVDGDR